MSIRLAKWYTFVGVGLQAATIISGAPAWLYTLSLMVYSTGVIVWYVRRSYEQRK